MEKRGPKRSDAYHKTPCVTKLLVIPYPELLEKLRAARGDKSIAKMIYNIVLEELGDKNIK